MHWHRKDTGEGVPVLLIAPQPTGYMHIAPLTAAAAAAELKQLLVGCRTTPSKASGAGRATMTTATQHGGPHLFLLSLLLLLAGRSQHGHLKKDGVILTSRVFLPHPPTCYRHECGGQGVISVTSNVVPSLMSSLMLRSQPQLDDRCVPYQA